MLFECTRIDYLIIVVITHLHVMRLIICAHAAAQHSLRLPLLTQNQPHQNSKAKLSALEQITCHKWEVEAHWQFAVLKTCMFCS